MAEEEKSATGQTTEEAEDEREAETSALAEHIHELETLTTDHLQGMWDYLEGIVDWHGLNVNTNKGGPNSRTREQFRDDIIAALEARLAVERDVARVTAQLEETQIQAVERVAPGSGNWRQLGVETMSDMNGFQTDEDIEAEGGINYLRRIIRAFDLRRVNHNVGGWDPVRRRVVTLMHVKDDIYEDLFNRMPSEPDGTPYYYNSDDELTDQPILTDAEDSDVDGQAEPQREQETDEEESGSES